MTVNEMDTSNGVLLPFYDPDTNVVYLCGKVSPLLSNQQPKQIFFITVDNWMQKLIFVYLLTG